ncbi:Histone H1.5 [Acipenser ruthenus]|uniref:Histone H1 n=1 Tax=Acipenser ruthenus TaxID=7906 RepID=A0A444UNK5_ACIRT|nr:Histone H1.5 [Acipenser ruthenus]
MAETVPAPAAAPAKAPKKKTADYKSKKTGASVSELIVKAVSASKERSGLSLAALKKALAADGYDVENNSRLKVAIKSLVSKETLVQTKGTGASGSFKINRKQAEAKEKAAKKKAAPKAKKPAAAKQTTASAKKASRKEASRGKEVSQESKETGSGKESSQEPEKSESCKT